VKPQRQLQNVHSTDLKDTHTHFNSASRVTSLHTDTLQDGVMYLDIFLLMVRILRVQEMKQPPALIHPQDKTWKLIT